MKRDTNIVGLDIGNSSISAAICNVDKDTINVAGVTRVESDGVTNGVITNLSKVSKSIKLAIEQLGELSGCNISRVNVSTFGRHVSARTYHCSKTIQDTGYEISQGDVDEMYNDVSRLPVQDNLKLIDIIPQRYKVDYSSGIKDPVGMIGTHLEGDFYLLLSDKLAISRINRCVQRCDLELGCITLSPTVSGTITTTRDEREAGICVIDIGGGNTNVAIFSRGILLKVASIPFGGINVTDDIKYGLQLSWAQAETVKVKYGNAISGNINYDEVISLEMFDDMLRHVSVYNLSQVIEARMREIIHFVQNQLEDMLIPSVVPAGIVLIGGGARLNSVKELVEQQTGIYTRIGEMKDNTTKMSGDVTTEYAAAIGTVLHCVSMDNTRDDNHSEKKKQSLPGFVSRTLKRVKSFLIDDYTTQE